MLLAVDDESLDLPQLPDNDSNNTENSIPCVSIENGDIMDVV